ncbi:MAG: hypothetical protein ACRDAO_07535 [Culicoidibacterales bacterium]
MKQFYFHIAAIRWGIDDSGQPIITDVRGSYQLNTDFLVEKPRAVIERLILNEQRIVLKHYNTQWERGIEVKSFCANGICSLRIDYAPNLDDYFPADFPSYT